MKDVIILDTCILTNLLGVPGKNESEKRVKADFSRLVKAKRAELIIPISAIIETGNHIGQLKSGGKRRGLAEELIKFVRLGFSRRPPWTPTPDIRQDSVLAWLEEWPNLASEGVGLGDVAILGTFNELVALHKPLGRRVYIWSTDSDFKGRADVVERPPS